MPRIRSWCRRMPEFRSFYCAARFANFFPFFPKQQKLESFKTLSMQPCANVSFVRENGNERGKERGTAFEFVCREEIKHVAMPRA